MAQKQGQVSNAELGRILGVTHTQISRLRSGKRHPSPTLMVKFESLMGWPLEEQVRLVASDTNQDGQGPRTGVYAKALDVVLTNWDPNAPVPTPRTECPYHRNKKSTELTFTSPFQD